MARALIIDAEVQAKIKAAMDLAVKNPIPLHLVKQGAVPHTPHLKLEDRNPNAGSITPRSQHVEIPVGYRAAISYEEQPIGLCKHLSVSVDRKGFLPSPEAVQMIAHEFGIEVDFNRNDNNVMMWREEFDPGHEAINLVAPVVM